jgi:ribonucleotide monophosphatase NagD (HAD superfamily)
LDTDIAFGRNGGIATLMVLTGLSAGQPASELFTTAHRQA